MVNSEGLPTARRTMQDNSRWELDPKSFVTVTVLNYVDNVFIEKLRQLWPPCKLEDLWLVSPLSGGC